MDLRAPSTEFLLAFFEHARVSAAPDEAPEISEPALVAYRAFATEMGFDPDSQRFGKLSWLKRQGLLIGVYEKVFTREVFTSPVARRLMFGDESRTA